MRGPPEAQEGLGRPPPRPVRAHRRASTAALLLVGLAWIFVMQAPGSNQNAHLALVKSIARGTPTVDRYHHETPDVSYIAGHYYTAKAPGLALATVPFYLALRAAHLVVADRVAALPYPQAMYRLSRVALWQMALAGAALPALVLLFLVRGVADRLVPGYGAAAAVAVGAASVVGLFATLFFAHALSACLGFAAFALLVRERSRPSARLASTAGAVAGLAVVVEFPLALVAVALALYAAVGHDRLRRLSAYAAGVVAGGAPLLAFDAWAFGSPFTLAYTNAVSVPGRSGHDVVGANAAGFFGVQTPNLRAAVDLLVSSKGLLVLMPVWALASAGIVALWRRGARAEAALVGGLAAAFVVYDSAYYLPFGGFPGGPRFLVPLVPFLALGLAAAASVRPLETFVLGVASAVVTAVALVVDPGSRSEDAGTWFHALERGHVTETLVGWAGGSNRVGAAVSLALVTAAVALAVAASPRAIVTRRRVLLALLPLLLWRAVYVGAPILLDAGSPRWLGLVTVVALVGAAAACVVRAASVGARGAAPAVGVVVLAWPAFAAHTALAAAAVGASAAACLTIWALDWTRTSSLEQSRSAL